MELDLQSGARAPGDLPSTHTEAPLLTQRDGASCYCTILPISIHALKFAFSDTNDNGNHEQETFALSLIFLSLYPIFSFIMQSFTFWRAHFGDV